MSLGKLRKHLHNYKTIKVVFRFSKAENFKTVLSFIISNLWTKIPKQRRSLVTSAAAPPILPGIQLSAAACNLITSVHQGPRVPTCSSANFLIGLERTHDLALSSYLIMYPEKTMPIGVSYPNTIGL